MSLDEYGDNNDTGEERFTLAHALRNKFNQFQEEVEERLDELEAENAQLRREIAELKDEGGEF